MSTTTTKTSKSSKPTIVASETPAPSPAGGSPGKALSQSDTPFLSAAYKSGSSAPFWQSYVDSRPSPAEDFFQLLCDYHHSRGNSRTRIAHDIGTGPGNIAARLTAYFDHVVGSDINKGALAAAPAIVPVDALPRMSFIHSPAEALPHNTPADIGGRGTTDLITISECMPLLDTATTLKTARTLLRPDGTLAIYFYGPAIFTDGNADQCNAVFDRLATRICKFNQPMKGTPGFPFHLHAAEALLSNMDSLAIPSEEWDCIERHKWNCDQHSILFNSKEGFDFEWSLVDRRGPDETTIEKSDRHFWEHHWDVDDVKAYLDSIYPNWKQKAGEQVAELEPMWQELSAAMGDGKRNVTFSAVLILATKKEVSNMPKASQVSVSTSRLGLGRIDDSPSDAIPKLEKLLQLNHEEFHAFSKQMDDHNSLAESLLAHFTMGASATDLQLVCGHEFRFQCDMPKVDIDVVDWLSKDSETLKDLFGKPAQYANALTFFQQQIDDFGWQAVMHKYCFNRSTIADTLLARMFKGAFHPFIHLGLAVEFGLPSIMAEALARAVVHPSSAIPTYLKQIEEAASPIEEQAPRKPLLDHFTEARAKLVANRSNGFSNDFSEEASDRTITEILSLASQYRVNPSNITAHLTEVINTSAYIAGACLRPINSPEVDVFLMNSVASTTALTALVQDPYISPENKARMIEYKARVNLLWYAAMDCPKLDI